MRDQAVFKFIDHIAVESVVVCRECDVDEYASRVDLRSRGWVNLMRENRNGFGWSWTGVCEKCAHSLS